MDKNLLLKKANQLKVNQRKNNQLYHNLKEAHLCKVNLLKANNSTWQNQIRPKEINHIDLGALKRRIINFLF